MPPTLTDRVALRLLKAAAQRLQSSSVQLDKAGRLTSAPLQSAISQLAFQVAKQGLAPEDLDRSEGQDALHAIATAVQLKKANTVVNFMPLPDEWKHVVNAAYRQAETFVSHIRS